MTPAPRDSRGSEAPAGEPAPLTAGRVGRPHGLDGSFYVTGARPRLLSVGAALSLAGVSAAIVRRAGTDRRPIIRLEGIGDRAGVEAVRGSELTVARAQAPALEDGEWWAHELEGCEVRDGERLLGTVSRLLELPSCEALEVRTVQGGSPLLVPMVKDAVRRVQVAAGYIEVDSEFLGLGESSPPPGEQGGRS